MSFEDSRFRSIMTFGTGPGAPTAATVSEFRTYAKPLMARVPSELQKEFLSLEHDMSGGSDRLYIVDGLIKKAAAELWAADEILTGELAPLTMFHHARALYEAHALAYWLCKDFANRWKRVLKDGMRERLRFEDEYKKSIGAVPSDITDAGQALIDDDSIKLPPRVFDQTSGNAVLTSDYAFFWKYSSAHVHAGHMETGTATVQTERWTIGELLRGLVRHAAGTYREIANFYDIGRDECAARLRDAEDYATNQRTPSTD